MWVVGLVDSRQVTTAGGGPAGGPAMAVVTHITGHDANKIQDSRFKTYLFDP